MKRDMDLIRRILMDVEEADVYAPRETPMDASLEKYQYHCWLLVNAGWAKPVDGFDRIDIIHIEHLTWEGQEFLNAIRHDTIWNKIKAALGGSASTVTIGVIQAMAQDFALKMFVHGVK